MIQSYRSWIIGFLTCLTLILSGCATSVHTSVYPNHFISPESSGGFLKGNVAIGVTTGQELVIISAAASPGAKVSPTFEANTDVALDLWLGIIKGIDIEPLQATGLYGLKLQILGDSVKDAKEGNFSVALFARYGSIDENQTINDYTIFQGTVGTVYSTSHRRTYDGGLSFGYRTNENIVFSATPFYTKRTFQGSLNTSTPVPFSGVFAQYGLDLGVEWRSGFGVLKGDMALTESEAMGIHVFNPYIGLEFGVTW